MAGPAGTHAYLPSAGGRPLFTKDDAGRRVDVAAFEPDTAGMATPEGWHRVVLPATMGPRVVFMDASNYQIYSDTVIRAEAGNLDAMSRQLRGITDSGLPSLAGAGGVFLPRAPGRLGSIPDASAPQFTAPLNGIVSDSAYRESTTGLPFFVRVTSASGPGEGVIMEGIVLNDELGDTAARARAVEILKHTGLIPHQTEGGGPIVWAAPQAWQNFLARGGFIEAAAVPVSELTAIPTTVPLG